MRQTHRRSSPIPSALVLLLALAACGGAEVGPEGSEGLPVWITSDDAVRIGSVDDPEYAFSAVSQLAMAPDGRLYSTHSNETSVRRWTPEGRPDGTIGREGEGPGEFMSPRTLGFLGDSLWVMDFRTYRASFFDSGGGFLGSVSPRVELGSPETMSSPPARPDRPLRDGAWYGRTPGFSDEIARGDLSEGHHVRMDASGAVLDTVWTQEWRPTDIWAILRDRGGSFMPQPYGDGPLFHVADDGGMLVVDRRAYDGEGEASFRLTRLDADGDTVMAVPVPFRPEALPRTHADSTLNAQAEEMHGFMERFRPGSTTLEGTRTSLAETLYRPEYLPAVKKLVVAAGGNVWLQRHLLDASRGEWWVFDARGTRIATASIPPELDVRLIRGAWVWGVETDDLEVSYIVGYPLLDSVVDEGSGG